MKSIFTISIAVAACLGAHASPLLPPAKSPESQSMDWETAVNDPAAAGLARPTAVQYAWHEQERIMFVCLDPATWQGREYDNHTTKLADMKLDKLNVEQWMAAANAWGAREILLVCKHTGGFCWWPTQTTDYCVRKIPWENGQGNLVKEVADACRKHGLSVGVYLYSQYTGITTVSGTSVHTGNAANREEWPAQLRQQWKEVLGIDGKDLVREVWFDGSCGVPLNDVIGEMAPNAVVFQSALASIRWVGNEAGVAPDPNWNTLDRKSLATGVATAAHSTPDGDAWAPVECDTTLYDHYWFWSENGERARVSLDYLLSRYLLSVGRGSVLLLNSTPNTSGLIPDGDMKLYRDFNQAIDDNFGHPVGRIEQIAGREIILPLGAPKAINCVDLWEDYRYGHRIRKYEVDAWVQGQWILVSEGTAVGRRKIAIFPEVTTDKVRIEVTKQVGTPLFRQIMVHKVTPALAVGTMATPFLVRGATVKASSEHSAPYAAKYVMDGNKGTRWGATDSDTLAWLEFDLQRPHRFAGLTASELSDRIRGYVVEVRNQPDTPWRTIFSGGKVGDNLKVDMPATTARYVRFRVTSMAGGLGPTIWEMNFYDRPDAWEEIPAKLPADGSTFDIDLSGQVSDPGQYEVRIEGAQISGIHPLFENQLGEDKFLENIGAGVYRLNRTGAVDKDSSTGIRVTAKPSGTDEFKVLIRPK